MVQRCYHYFDSNFTGYNNSNNHNSFGSNGPGPTSNINNNMTIMIAQLDLNTESSWFPDSGSTNHVTNDLANLNIVLGYIGTKKPHIRNGTGLQITHIGNSIVHARDCSKTFLLKNLLRVPNITNNLSSVSQFARDNKVYFEFHASHCFVKDQVTWDPLLKGTLKNGL